MISWGIILILVVSAVPFLFLNNWLNLIKTYNKSILLKSGLYIVTSIIMCVIIAVKFGYKNIDDLVSVADNFFEYIKNSFIFRYVSDGGLLANVEKPFKAYSKTSSSVFAVIACIANIFLLCVYLERLEDDFEQKNGTCSMVLHLSLSVIFAITTVLMFVFKENGSIISLMLLILFSAPLVMCIIKTQYKRKVYILQNTAMLSTILFSLIFGFKYVIYAWIGIGAFILMGILGIAMYGGGGGSGGSKPKPTYFDELEKQSKKISAIKGELYDGEWTYKDGYITDGFTKRKVVDSDLSGRVITDEYGQTHTQTHSSEIDD